jgi:hypothetical protein
MKRYLYSLLFAFLTVAILKGQTSDQIVSNCAMNAGSDAKYIKDFRVQLGSSSDAAELRYKAQLSLMKNFKYRFSMCNTQDSKGQLILRLKDDTSRTVLSSLDEKSGKTYSSVDFICNKSGLYEISYDFVGGQQGSGVGVVSMIK